MGSLIIPTSVAQKRRAELAAQQPAKGLRRAFHEIDPKKAIYDQIGMTEPGKLIDRETGKPFRLHGNRVLVGVYKRPESMKVGDTDKKLFLSDQTRKEDEYQGKSALVLMLGHTAFKSDQHFDFGPDKAEVGDWVSLWVVDGKAVIINGQLCRVLRDQDICMVLPAPDVVF